MSYSFSLSKLNFLLVVRKIPLRYKFQPNWCQNVSRALILKRSQFIPQSISLLFTFPSIFSYKKANSINSSLSVIEQVDSALRAGSYDKAVSDLRELLKDDAANFELVWRLSYACWCNARDKTLKSPEQLNLFAEALIYAQKAYEMDPNHAAAHKMMGIALTEANLGKREKLANSNRVYNHLKTACELNPDDPEAHYFYGSVCFVACVIPSTVKSIAGLFVSLPKSSFEEALLHFSSAENLKPNFMCRNQFAMAKTYEMLGQFKEAHYWMEKASRFEAHTVKDKKDRNDAIETLNKWKTNKNFKLFFM